MTGHVPGKAPSKLAFTHLAKDSADLALTTPKRLIPPVKLAAKTATTTIHRRIVIMGSRMV